MSFNNVKESNVYFGIAKHKYYHENLKCFAMFIVRFELHGKYPVFTSDDSVSDHVSWKTYKRK